MNIHGGLVWDGVDRGALKSKSHQLQDEVMEQAVSQAAGYADWMQRHAGNPALTRGQSTLWISPQSGEHISAESITQKWGTLVNQPYHRLPRFCRYA